MVRLCSIIGAVVLWSAFSLRFLSDHVVPGEVGLSLSFENMMSRPAVMCWIGTLTDANLDPQTCFDLPPHQTRTFNVHLWHMHLIKANATTADAITTTAGGGSGGGGGGGEEKEKSSKELWHLMVTLPGMSSFFVHDNLPTFGEVDQEFVLRSIVRAGMHPFIPIRWLNHHREFFLPVVFFIIGVLVILDWWENRHLVGAPPPAQPPKDAQQQPQPEAAAASSTGSGGGGEDEEKKNKKGEQEEQGDAHEKETETEREDDGDGRGLRHRHIAHGSDDNDTNTTTNTGDLDKTDDNDDNNNDELPPPLIIITTHDRFKFGAFVAMFVDHVGRCLFPDMLWFRVVSRSAAMPVFLFLNGYGSNPLPSSAPASARLKRNSALKIFMAFLFCRYVAGMQTLSEGTILVQHVIAHLFLSHELLARRSTAWHCFALSAMFLLHPFVSDSLLFDAGMAPLMFACAGQLRRSCRTKRQYLLCCLYLLCACFCHASNSFRTEYKTAATSAGSWESVWLPAFVAMMLFLPTFFSLSQYQRKPIPAATTRLGVAMQQTMRFISKRGLELYVLHVVALDQASRYFYGRKPYFML